MSYDIGRDMGMDEYREAVYECIQGMIHSIEMKHSTMIERNENNSVTITSISTLRSNGVTLDGSESDEEEQDSNEQSHQTVGSIPSTLSSHFSVIEPIIQLAEEPIIERSPPSLPLDTTAYSERQLTETCPPSNIIEEADAVIEEADAVIEEADAVNISHEMDADNMSNKWDPKSNIIHIPDEKETEKQDSYDRIWNKRKLDMEKQAETRAQKRIRELDREGKNLEEIIDISLKEYAEFHEMAHTVRLKFEDEKAKFLKMVQQLVSNNSNQQQGGFGGPNAHPTSLEFEYMLDSDDEDENKKYPNDNIFRPEASFSAPKPGRSRPFAVPFKL